MAIKAGQILHAMNQFVLDRIQAAGPGNLNIPTEKIRELGNEQSVATVRDVPDLSFNLECLDVDTEVEALLTGSDDPGNDTFGTDGLTGTKYSLTTTVPVDIISPFKSAIGAFDIVRGVAIPNLTLEAASYRYGLEENAGETFTLRGDSIYYIPGQPYICEYLGDGIETQFAFNDDRDTNQPSPLEALKYVSQGVDLYALSVSVDGQRMRPGADADYTQDKDGIEFVDAPGVGAKIRIVFGAAQNTTYPQTVHEALAVKPAAIKGKDIKVYVGGVLWDGVQSATVDWRVTLEDDFEFGNPNAVAREPSDVPEVTGQIEIKPISAENLFDKLEQITGVSSGEVIGPHSSTALSLEIQLLNPESGGTEAQPAGTVMKTLYIPDVRFTMPGYEGRVQQKLVPQLSFESDSGVLEIFKGMRF